MHDVVTGTSIFLGANVMIPFGMAGDLGCDGIADFSSGMTVGFMMLENRKSSWDTSKLLLETFSDSSFFSKLTRISCLLFQFSEKMQQSKVNINQHFQTLTFGLVGKSVYWQTQACGSMLPSFSMTSTPSAPIYNNNRII
jgi:hypothetical protein